MKDEKIKAWVTKYALTTGIKLVDGEVCNGTMLSYDTYSYAHGNDWHRTPEAALERAEEMRKAKIGSLRKSLAKMQRLEFKAPRVIF